MQKEALEVPPYKELLIRVAGGPNIYPYKENCFVPAIWGVKQPRDHLPIYKLDLPDPIFMVPDLKKWNLRTKNPTN